MNSRSIRTVACLLYALVLLGGCDTGPPEPETTLLVGKVYCNGTPIPEGWILFIPLDGQGEDVNAKIVDGNYRAANVPVGRVQAVISANQQGERRSDSTEEEVRYKKIKLVPLKYREGVERKIVKGQTSCDFDMRGPTEEPK